ncbi:hypothetical protein HELRODRAFT_183433 [Helobdella robusta]|uniref:F-box domain-containing protein n=1 Tax=Helobdella robusta TaxID=6412 RepID=T1FJN1_HELRO|nr:hypothetical protein HELRODRAFT_183433 [Helobdella robusta]ESO11192.1 hypothetical protein HELRODRAFT_183433 [Helobdella robusta]
MEKWSEKEAESENKKTIVNRLRCQNQRQHPLLSKPRKSFESFNTQKISQYLNENIFNNESNNRKNTNISCNIQSNNNFNTFSNKTFSCVDFKRSYTFDTPSFLHRQLKDQSFFYNSDDSNGSWVTSTSCSDENISGIVHDPSHDCRNKYVDTMASGSKSKSDELMSACDNVMSLSVTSSYSQQQLPDYSNVTFSCNNTTTSINNNNNVSIVSPQKPEHIPTKHSKTDSLTFDAKLKKFLRDNAPPCLENLIGRKMGLTYYDIIEGLFVKGAHVLLGKIMSHLSDEDLVRFTQVSRLWKNVLECDLKCRTRRRHFVAVLKKKLLKAGKENLIQHDPTRALMRIQQQQQNQALTDQPKRKAMSDRHEAFVAVSGFTSASALNLP